MSKHSIKLKVKSIPPPPRGSGKSEDFHKSVKTQQPRAQLHQLSLNFVLPKKDAVITISA
jgi:hypothetical protein